MSINIKEFIDNLEKVKKATKKARDDVSKQLSDLSIKLPPGEERKLADQIIRAGKKATKASEKAGKQAGKAYSNGFNNIMQTALGVGIGNLLTKGLASATNLISQATTEFLELDTAVNNIGTLGVENFRNFFDVAIDGSKNLLDTSATVAKGIYQAYSAGMQGSQEEVANFVTIASQAAVAGLTDTESAVNGMTSVINAYGLSIEDATGVADTFFAGIKLGKTTFEEMNASLASFLPSASALKVPFDQATAAIAGLTAQGTPTAQAGTQMNTVFTLLAKGTVPLNEALKATGTDLDTLRNSLSAPTKDGGGLVNVLRKLKLAADNSGVQIEALTGRVEAAKIIRSLAGDVDKYTKSLTLLDKVQEEIAGGAAGKAFEIASKSVAVQFAGLKNTIIGIFQKIFGALLPVIVNITKAFTGIFDSPVMKTAIAGFTTAMVFLGDNIGKVGVVIGILSAGMIVLAVKAAAAAVATSALGVSIAAASGAMGVFNAVFRANPVVAYAAGIAVLVLGLLALSDALTDTTEERIAANKEQQKTNQALIDETKSDLKLEKSKVSLITKYNGLGKLKKRTAEQTKEYTKTLVELKRFYPDVIDLTASYEENISKLDVELGKTGDSASRLSDVNKDLVREFEFLSKKTNKSETEIKRLKEVEEKITKVYPELIDNNKKLITQLDALKGASNNSSSAVVGLTGSLDKLNGVQKTLAGIAIDEELNLQAEALNNLTATTLDAKGKQAALNILISSSLKGYKVLSSVIDGVTVSTNASVATSDLYSSKTIEGLRAVRKQLEINAQILFDNDKITKDQFKSYIKGIRSVERARIDKLKFTGTIEIDFFDEIVNLGDKVKDLPGIDLSVSLSAIDFEKDTKKINAAVAGVTRNILVAAEALNISPEGVKKYIATVEKMGEKRVEALTKTVDPTKPGGDGDGGTDEETKSVLALYEAKVKENEQTLKRNKLTAETTRLEAKRKKTKQDDLELEDKKNTLLKQQLVQLSGIAAEYRVIFDKSTGKVLSFGANVTDEDKEKFRTEIASLVLSIRASDNAKLNLQIGIDDESKKLDEKIAKLSGKSAKLELEIELKSDELALEQEFAKGLITQEAYESKKLARKQEFAAKELTLLKDSNDKLLEENKRYEAALLTEKVQNDKTETARLLELRKKNLKDISENKQKEISLTKTKGAEQIGFTDQLYSAIGATIEANLGNTIADILVGQEKAGAAFIQLGLQLLDAMVPVISAQIVAMELGGKGLAGIATSTALIVLLKGLVAAAHAAAGFKVGGYTGDGNPNEAAGTVHKGEYVIPAPMVSKIGLQNLKRLHKTGNLGHMETGRLADVKFTNNNETLDSRKTHELLANIAERVSRVEQATGAGFDRRNHIGISGKFEIRSKDLAAIALKRNKRNVR